MAKATIASHPWALYSLAVIKFNGSGGFRKDKVLKAKVVLCAKVSLCIEPMPALLQPYSTSIFAQKTIKKLHKMKP